MRVRVEQQHDPMTEEPRAPKIVTPDGTPKPKTPATRAAKPKPTTADVPVKDSAPAVASRETAPKQRPPTGYTFALHAMTIDCPPERRFPYPVGTHVKIAGGRQVRIIFVADGDAYTEYYKRDKDGRIVTDKEGRRQIVRSPWNTATGKPYAYTSDGSGILAEQIEEVVTGKHELEELRKKENEQRAGLWGSLEP